MTKEFYKKLQPYEQKFKWAIQSNFISMSPGEFSNIAALYQELYGQGLTKSQSNCNSCRLRALKKLGEDYFAKKAEIEEKERKKAEAETPAGEEKKNKVGRPPKIDLNAE